MPGTLDPPEIFASNPGFETGVIETINVTLNNPNDPTVSQIEYRINGSIWTVYASPLTLAIGDYSSGATIAAKAVPSVPHFNESSVVEASIAEASIVEPADGIERTTGIDPGSWTISGNAATYTFGDGTSVVLTEVGTSWSKGTVNSWDAWSKTIDSSGSVEATFSPNDQFTLKVFDSTNQQITPVSIELHFDRLGGSQGSGIFTLQGETGWGATGGNTGFVATSNTVKTGLSGTNLSAGSVILDQSASSFTIVNEGALDRIGLQVTISTSP